MFNTIQKKNILIEALDVIHDPDFINVNEVLLGMDLNEEEIEEVFYDKSDEDIIVYSSNNTDISIKEYNHSCPHCKSNDILLDTQSVFFDTNTITRTHTCNSCNSSISENFSLTSVDLIK